MKMDGRLHAPTALPPLSQERPSFSIEWDAGCAPEQSWHFGKVSHASAGIRTPNHPARSLVSVPTMISRLPQFWKVFQVQIARFNEIYILCHTNTFCDWRCGRNSTWLAQNILSRWTIYIDVEMSAYDTYWTEKAQLNILRKGMERGPLLSSVSKIRLRCAIALSC